jgi:hypothetical protein
MQLGYALLAFKEGADMAALRTAPRTVPTRRPSPPRFEIGDRVLLEPNGAEGLVVGVRYGAPAYDVQVNGACLRNLPPERIRLAESAGAGSIVPLRRLAPEMPDFLF